MHCDMNDVLPFLSLESGMLIMSVVLAMCTSSIKLKWAVGRTKNRNREHDLLLRTQTTRVLSLGWA
eukprot:9050696-Prorocentrum_lima.AAC.1